MNPDVLVYRNKQNKPLVSIFIFFAPFRVFWINGETSKLDFDRFHRTVEAVHEALALATCVPDNCAGRNRAGGPWRTGALPVDLSARGRLSARVKWQVLSSVGGPENSHVHRSSVAAILVSEKHLQQAVQSIA